MLVPHMLAPGMEEHESKGHIICVQRKNTRLNGYQPFLREVQGVALLIIGTTRLAIGCLKNSEQYYLIGKACIKDGLINLTHSPITLLATSCFLVLRYLNFESS